MTTGNIIRVVAGAFVIISVLLAQFVDTNWLYFTLFVGVNLLQSGFTKWCPLEKILFKLGLSDGSCSV